jgi:predicted trehalose synthase
VAGMLRSVDSAAAEARGGDPESVRRLRRAFLDGYHETAGDGAFLPRSAGAAASLLAFFERDKALYEVVYELNHRPDWIGIPLRGLNALLEGGAA